MAVQEVSNEDYIEIINYVLNAELNGSEFWFNKNGWREGICNRTTNTTLSQIICAISYPNDGTLSCKGEEELTLV